MGVQTRFSTNKLFKPDAYGFDYEISNQSCTNSLPFNWSATGRNKGSVNVTGKKFKSSTCIQPHTHAAIERSPCNMLSLVPN